MKCDSCGREFYNLVSPEEAQGLVICTDCWKNLQNKISLETEDGDEYDVVID